MDEHLHTHYRKRYYIGAHALELLELNLDRIGTLCLSYNIYALRSSSMIEVKYNI